MSVPHSQRERYHKQGTVEVAGVTLYKYKYIDYKGKSKNHLVTTQDRGSRVGTYGSSGRKTNFGDDYSATTSSYKEDKILESKYMRDYVVDNSPNEDLREIYNNYRKNPNELTQAQKDKVSEWNDTDEDTFKLYLQFGAGLQSDKLDEYVGEGAASFDSLTEKTADDFEDWAKDKDINNWIAEDSPEGIVEEGQTTLKEEGAILQGDQDPRYALIEEMFVEQEISASER